MLRKVKIDEAIGLVIGHDVTRIIPGKFKGPAFRRGHVITREDIPELRSIGKEHVYVIELEEDEVHEEEAALRIARAASGKGLELTKPREGRVNFKAGYAGILRVNADALRRINSIGEIVMAARHDHTYCKAGAMVAGTKIVPLFITGEELEKVERICGSTGPVIEMVPLQEKSIGLVITGNEVSYGIIKDGFGDLIGGKVSRLGSVVAHRVIVPDDEAAIAEAIHEVKARGSDVIIVCGGLSVDPDDVTVDGVKKSGAKIISYGAPVMPGAMFLLAELDGIPVLGAPSAVIHNPATVIDIILPRVLAGEKVTREDIIELGHGGLCLLCEKCVFPDCPFGK